MNHIKSDKDSSSSCSSGLRAFGPEKRIKKRSDFLEVQSNGRKWRSGNFLVSVLKTKSSPDHSLARIGITITTKVDKRAVRRNRLKRRIREIFRILYDRLNFEKSDTGDSHTRLDIVIIALNGSVDLSYKEIRDQIYFCFRRLQLISSAKKRNQE
ncbi:MAG TPA: ribonuclease P protein component [Oligoflexia bacterium]|nr:ribonuclease P protein component [Oligoflexia bacterium]HMP48112.1 ribonuclease P protein component [Oligoflexia bacterium]